MDLKNPILLRYLEYVEDTETPRIMHVWAFLTGAAACLGRRVYLPFGNDALYPNLYTLLVGPPGVRKSTAINIMRKLLVSGTNVKLAPDDTSGKRQGLIKAMEGAKDDDIDEAVLDAAIKAADLTKIGNFQMKIDPRDAHCMIAVASEFATFIGQNSLDMINFLNKTYDGEDYQYQITTGEMLLKDPLLSIIGGTTPTIIADALPASAIGHGFTSRIIMVFDNKKYKRVARPRKLPEKLRKELQTTFSWLANSADGPLQETDEAAELIDKFYDVKIPLDDTRFVYYVERRQQHMLKVAIILATLRRSSLITVDDITEAHEILAFTEIKMPESLGEYGLSKLSAAKQQMLDFLQHYSLHQGPCNSKILWAAMSRDMTWIEFQNSIGDMLNSGKIVQVTTHDGQALVYKDIQTEDDVLRWTMEN